jgi:hypothetical protein
MGSAKPVEVHKMEDPNAEDDEFSWASSHTIYKWVVPWETKKADAEGGKPKE